MVLGLLVFEATVHRHQLYYRLRNDLKAHHFSVIFPGVGRQHLDRGVVPCLKYFVNFCYYKFGLEVSVSRSLLEGPLLRKKSTSGHASDTLAGRGVAQEAERVGWEPGGRQFGPRLLLAVCRGVPEREGLTPTAPHGLAVALRGWPRRRCVSG